MEKIKLKLCMGTMCYIMGGAELKDIAEVLPEEVKQYIDISFSSCLGFCNDRQAPPYIELNGRVVAGVSKTSLIQLIKEEIRHVI